MVSSNLWSPLRTKVLAENDKRFVFDLLYSPHFVTVQMTLAMLKLCRSIFPVAIVSIDFVDLCKARYSCTIDVSAITRQYLALTF